jgi:hypothetical protein
MSETNTTFTIKTDTNNNAILFANTANGQVQIKGSSKITMTYAIKGRAAGTKINVTMLTPIVKGGISDMRSETYELPRDLDKVLALSEFWDQHAVVEAADTPKKTSKKSTSSTDNDDEIEIEEGAEVETVTVG